MPGGFCRLQTLRGGIILKREGAGQRFWSELTARQAHTSKVTAKASSTSSSKNTFIRVLLGAAWGPGFAIYICGHTGIVHRLEKKHTGGTAYEQALRFFRPWF